MDRTALKIKERSKFIKRTLKIPKLHPNFELGKQTDPVSPCEVSTFFLARYEKSEECI